MFVLEYMIDFNATQAAIRAKYSPKTAYHQGWENLKKPHIMVAIQKQYSRRERNLKRSADDVILEMEKIGFMDIVSLYKKDGTLKELDDLDKDERTILASVQTRITKTVKGEETTEFHDMTVKVWDKLRALYYLGQHHRLWKPEEAPADDFRDRIIYYPFPVEEGAPVIMPGEKIEALPAPKPKKKKPKKKTEQQQPMKLEDLVIKKAKKVKKVAKVAKVEKVEKSTPVTKVDPDSNIRT